ncbi:MAG: hypothetical protein AB1347_11850, partial [Acidobacteriota bacterium]
EMPLEQGRWYTVTFQMAGDRIEGFLDGKKYLEVVDGAISSPGRVGLWTKVDAATHFDEFAVSSP